MLAILVTKIVNFSVHKLKPHVLESGSLYPAFSGRV